MLLLLILIVQNNTVHV